MTNDDIDQRLDRDGQQWRTNRPAGPALSSAIVNLASEPPVRRWRAALASSVVVLVIAAGAVLFRLLTGSPTVVAANGSHLSTCGKTPTSRGPLSSRLELTLTAPGAARTGTKIKVTARLRATAAPVGSFDAAAPADVLIVLNGYVVGRYEGSIGGTGLGGPVGPKPYTVPTDLVLLSGCPSGPIDYAHPDASRHPLPTGRYGLVAVLDSEGHGKSFQIISPPTAILVTR